MLLAYLVLFFSITSEPTEEATEEKILDVYTIFAILAFFIPNVGIMIRRSVKSWRVVYNYLFTGINLLIAAGLVYYIVDIPWQFK
jgi:predicted membrane protein